MANLLCRPNWRGTGNNNNAVNFYQVNLGKKSHAGKVLGGGTSDDPVVSATSAEKMASFYTSNSEGSGHSVALYWKHTLTTTLSAGTVARFYAYTNVVGMSAVNGGALQGAQITAETGPAGSVPGLMVGCRSQVTLGDNATVAPTGTITGGQSEIYFNGDTNSTTDIGGATHSIHRFIVDGDTLARAKVVNLFEIKNVSTGTSNTTAMIKTDMHTAEPTDGIRVVINDAAYHIGLYAI